jgi:hypothetical protein
MPAVNLYKHLDTMDAMMDDVLTWWNHRNTPQGRRTLAQARRTFSDLSQTNGGGRTPYLFTTQDSSAKTAHNSDVYSHAEQIVQYKLPHSLSGLINLCIWSTPGCRATCLHTSGRLGMADIAKFVRVALFVKHPFEYLICFLSEVEHHAKRVAKCAKTLVVRPNGTSDVPWERLPWLFDLVASLGLGVQWFDYTKGILTESKLHRTPAPRPDYYLVASATERTTAETVANYDGNVVAVVNVRRGAPLPETFYGRQVVDGDRHDLRLFDPQDGRMVLVRAKGDAVKAPAGPRRFVKAV